MSDSCLIGSEQGSICIYFDDLGALQKWFNKRSLNERDVANIPNESLSSYRKFERPNLVSTPSLDGRKPELIVCHDFKGGYQPGHDLYPNGEYNIQSLTPYWLRYPELVDKFIYFSHHCVSIPAVCWTNYLHRHHIPVLGTLILENYSHDGELLKQKNDGEFIYVKLLVELCRIFKFEGWLVNFETGFRKHSGMVIPFLRELTSQVESKIHSGIIIWYDAYTTFSNKPSYQNEVNMLNWDAYTNSSQFMTNYMWDSRHVSDSLKNVGVLGMHSKVALGIDVWGRSMQVCGGGFESNIAISYAERFGTNAVLFAPAWTYEYFGEEKFLEKDDIFWENIKSTLNSKPYHKCEISSWFVSESSRTRWFTTFFSTGSGNFFNFNGKRILDESWVQLSLASPLPIHHRRQLYGGDSYVGGSCLALPLSPMENGKTHLFEFEQFLSSEQTAGNTVLKVSAAFKMIGALPAVNLVIKCFVVRRGRRSGTALKVKDISVALPLESDELQGVKWRKVEHTIPLPSLEAAFLEEYYVEGAQLRWTVDNHEGWMVVPEKTEDLDAKLLLGSLCIQVGGSDSIDGSYSTREGSNICRDDTFMWLVLQGARLDSVRFAPVEETLGSDKQVYEYCRGGNVRRLCT